jgi:hypothetical protein
MKRKVDIRPTSGVYGTYRRLSYKPWSAIAEFVDNSTQSFYDHKEELLSQKNYKKLKIEIVYVEDNIGGDTLTIYDTAYGMEWDDFQRALILDKPPKNTSGRNEFGMGLKTAACWFGSLWSIESTCLGSNKKYFAEMDVSVLEKYKNEEIDVTEESANSSEHYTKISIKRLNQRIRGGKTKGKIKDLLSSIYRQDLRSGCIEITYNGIPLEFEEVEPYKETKFDGTCEEWKKEISFIVEHEGKTLSVTGFVALRMPADIKNAGFTLLRRGRVIIGGPENNYRPPDLFGESNSFEYQRMYGEFHMDNWPVTQAKDDFDWHNSGLEEKFIDELKKRTSEYRTKAQQIRVREKVHAKDVADKLKEDLSVPGIIDVRVEEVLTTQNGESHLTKVPNENGSSYENKSVSDGISCGMGNDGIILDVRNLEVSLRYRGSAYKFKIILDLNSPYSQWVTVDSKEDDTYEMTINMKHPFFEPLINNKDFIPVMLKFVIAFILAEIESGKITTNGQIDPSDIRINMNDFLAVIANNEVKHNG